LDATVLLRHEEQSARPAAGDNAYWRTLAGRNEGVGERVVDDVHGAAVERGQRIARVGHELHLDVEALLFEYLRGLGVEQRRHADADEMANVDRLKPLTARHKRRSECRSAGRRRGLQEIPALHDCPHWWSSLRTFPEFDASSMPLKERTVLHTLTHTITAAPRDAEQSAGSLNMDLAVVRG